MSKETTKDFSAEIQLTAIEILNVSINLPTIPDISLSTFNFNINLESKAEASKKLVFVIVNVEIRSGDQQHVLGALTASCIFTIGNFDDIIKLNGEGVVDIPQKLTDMFNSISISTTRGVMFSTFKGTFLHNAVLPIVSPGKFQQVEKK